MNEKSMQAISTQKVRTFLVIPAKLVLDLIGERESILFKLFWSPAFAAVTV
jgi:hypothetical protein